MGFEPGQPNTSVIDQYRLKHKLDAALKLSHSIIDSGCINTVEGLEQIGTLARAINEACLMADACRVAAAETSSGDGSLNADRLQLNADRLQLNADRLNDTMFMSPIPYLTTSSKGIIIDANPAACELLGLPIDSLKNTALSIFITGESQPQYFRALRLLRELSVSSVDGLNLSFLGKDKLAIPTVVTAGNRGASSGPSICTWTITESSSQEPSAESGFYRVMEQLLSTNAQLTEARDQALKHSELKSQFVANINHELRTPLNGMIGMSELLMQTDMTEEQQEFASTIANCAGMLLDLISGVLDFSKIESGYMSIEQDDFDIRSLVEEAITVVRPATSAKDLELEAYISPRVPNSIRGDSVRTRQILLNLLSNAIKFTNRGSILIQVSMVNSGETLRLSVSDTGGGIPEECLGQLFEPFSQVGASTTRVDGGTGLGLCISKRLAELMGGSIEVQSRLNSGTTFTVYLPLEIAKPQLLPLESIGAASRAAPAEAQTEHAARLLLVEDNLVNQRVSLLQLKKLGFEADIASDGRQAVEAARRTHYDLILMDCHMPEMDGFEATRYIRESEAGCEHRSVIVALTAEAVNLDRGRCLAAGMDDYLSKPVVLDDIARIIDHWLPSLGRGEFCKASA